MDKTWKHYAKFPKTYAKRKPVTKDDILYDSFIGNFLNGYSDLFLHSMYHNYKYIFV